MMKLRRVGNYQLSIEFLWINSHVGGKSETQKNFLSWKGSCNIYAIHWNVSIPSFLLCIHVWMNFYATSWKMTFNGIGFYFICTSWRLSMITNYLAFPSANYSNKDLFLLLDYKALIRRLSVSGWWWQSFQNKCLYWQPFLRKHLYLR